MDIKRIEFESGELILTDKMGNKTRYPIATVLKTVVLNDDGTITITLEKAGANLI